MDKIRINGGHSLKGTVQISGSKNSALPIMAATLLTDEPCQIHNVSQLRDIQTMINLLAVLGLKIERQEKILFITPEKNSSDLYEASYDLVSQMRASVCVLGPLLAKRKQAKVSFPGGCVIGPRPIDLHLKGLQALGAEIHIEHGFIYAHAKELRGAEIDLRGPFGPSVLGTGNVMMAACLAKGKTIIYSCAREPEVVDLANFLISMGAKIKGAGTTTIEIEGVKNLSGTTYEVIPDRIETGTYLIAASITDGCLEIKGTQADHVMPIIEKLKILNQDIVIKENSIIIKGSRSNLKALDITTKPFPGFPTDMQAQTMALLCFAKGTSIITEQIYPDRFTHISELNRMGANISFKSGQAMVQGISGLSGADVMASDLRASAALILAGLAAEGTTTVSRIYHLDRGYENMEQKLLAVGADVERVH